MLLVAILLPACGGTQLHSSPVPGSLPQATEPSGDLLEEVQRRGVLRVATDPNYPPQSFLGLDGAWEGFDVEVAREVARRLNTRAEFVEVSFATVTAGNWAGRWDAHVGSMTVTPARSAMLRFSSPYYYTPAAFVVHAQSPLTAIADLAGRRVGVAAATTYADYLSNTLTLTDGALVVPAPAVESLIYQTDTLALQDLEVAPGERLDAVLTALPTVQSAIDRGEPLRLLGPPVYYESLAIAFDRRSLRDSEQLAVAVSTALAAMHADGTLTRLSLRFYGVDLTVKPPT